MAYADVAALKGRAGRLAGAWTSTSEPSDADLERFLDAVAAELDAVFASMGFGVPIEDITAAGALEGLNAAAALLIAIDATWPGGAGGAEVAALRDDLRAQVKAAMDAIAAGTYQAVVVLTSGSAGQGANNFWSKEPNYGLLTTGFADRLLSVNMRPAVYRDSKF